MAEWESGQVILGEYAIEKELGRGGMGRVWLVKSNSTGRRFAVKQALIRDEKHRKAFLTELQTWIDLPEHPNIVPCRFFRTVGDEIVIFADYVEGGSLADWIAKGKLTGLEQILDVAIQFAWGLHAIHERGLIHQDVKPGNVLMTLEGVPMVTDFGLARARLRAADGAFVSPALPPGQQSVLVSFGGMTPAYASPEQQSGKPLSRKTDIWSWGVSVLDMFMGGVSCPHGGHIASDVLEEFSAASQEDQGLPEMPREVADVLSRCFGQDPSARWPTTRDAASRIVSVYTDFVGRPYGRVEHTVKEAERSGASLDRRIGVITWQDPRERLRNAARTLGVKSNTLDTPTEISSPKAQAIADLNVFRELRELYEEEVKKGCTQHRPVLADICVDEGCVHIYLKDMPGSLTCFNRAIAILEELHERGASSTAAWSLQNAYLLKADVMAGTANLEEALALFDACISKLAHHETESNRHDLADLLGRAYQGRARVLTLMNDLYGASRALDKCIATCQHIPGWEGRRDIANAYTNKAFVHGSMGDLDTALRSQDAAIAIYEELVTADRRGEFEQNLVSAYVTKGNVFREAGHAKRAGMLYQTAAEICERLITQDGRRELTGDLAMAVMNQAVTTEALGDASLAARLYDKAIALFEQLREVEGQEDLSESAALTFVNRAKSLAKAGDLEGSVNLFSRGIRLYERLVSGGRIALTEAYAMSLLGRALCYVEIHDELRAGADARLGVALLQKEIQRTGRADLSHVVTVMKQALKHLLE